MSRRLQEKRANKAQKLQRDVDRLDEERMRLLDSAAKAGDFKTKSDIWKVVRNLELKIERLSRNIRRLQTPPKEAQAVTMLWDFVPQFEAKPKAKKGGRS